MIARRADHFVLYPILRGHFLLYCNLSPASQYVGELFVTASRAIGLSRVSHIFCVVRSNTIRHDSIGFQAFVGHIIRVSDEESGTEGPSVGGSDAGCSFAVYGVSFAHKDHGRRL